MGFFHGGAAGGWSSDIGGEGGRWAQSRNRGGHGDEPLASVFNPRVIRRLLGYLAPYRRLTAVSFLSMIVYSVTSYIQPLLVTLAVREFIGRGDLSGLTWLMIAFAAVAATSAVAELVRQWTTARLGHQLLLHLRTRLFDHLQSLSPRFYDNAEVGRVMSRVTSDVQVLQELLSSGVLTAIADIIGLVIVVVALLLLDWMLALVTFTVLPVLVVSMILWSRWARLAFVQVRVAIAWVNGTLNEDLSGVRVVQSLQREDENARRFDQVNRYHLDATRRAAFFGAAVLPVVEILTAVATGAVILVAGLRLSNGDLDPATGVAAVVGFTLYIQRFFDPVRDLVLQYTMFQRAMTGAERIFEVLDTAPEIVDQPDALALDDIRGAVEFRNVSLAYVPGVEVLHGINLRVRPGETVALVGPTGAGKTSITALISRAYDATSGAVLIDGQDVRDVQRRTLTRRMGVVLQDPHLFSGSVADNIRYGRLEASDADVEAAAAVVGADGWIRRLPQGYATFLQERGQNLSVGQRQLIAFARAILAEPRILILDEATANVDSQTEAVIQAAIGRILHGRTSFVIAHRLSTIRHADRILVVQDGRIAEEGTHEALLAQGGLYADLYRMRYREYTGAGFDEAAALATLDRLYHRPRHPAGAPAAG